MKMNIFSGFRSLLLIRFMLIMCLFLYSFKQPGNALLNTYIISGSANGNNVVPARAGNGIGAISGTYNPADHSLIYVSTWTGLTGKPLDGGFYEGLPKQAGHVIEPLWQIPAGASGTGNISGTIVLTEAQANDLVGGKWYFQFNTADNPQGEIRGKILASPVTEN